MTTCCVRTGKFRIRIVNDGSFAYFVNLCRQITIFLVLEFLLLQFSLEDLQLCLLKRINEDVLQFRAFIQSHCNLPYFGLTILLYSVHLDFLTLNDAGVVSLDRLYVVGYILFYFCRFFKLSVFLRKRSKFKR